MSDSSRTDRSRTLVHARAIGGVVVIVALLAAFLLQVARNGEVEPWLVLVVSVLGLAAGAAILGADAVRTGYRLLRGSGEE